jgi:heat shock protein HslJ
MEVALLHWARQQEDDMAERDGRTWRLVRGVVEPATAGITARFVDGTVSGTIGGFHYRAAFTDGGSDMRVGPASTNGDVPDGPGRSYLALLGAVAAWRGDGDAQLELVDEQGTPLLTFEPAPEVETGLVGRWTVSSVAGRNGDDGDDGREERRQGDAPSAWFEIAADGAVTGHGGVNRYNAQMRTDGDRVYLTPLRMTRMAGDPEAMAAESALSDALGRVASYRLDGDRLDLRDQDDEVVVRLRRG